MTVSPTTDNRAALARRLKSLRQHRWPGESVPQRMLAEAFGNEKPLSLSLISAWESENNPAAPQPARLHDYATFFATKESIAGGRGRLIPDDELNADEISARDELYRSLLSLGREAADLSAATAEVPIRFDWQFSDGGN